MFRKMQKVLSILLTLCLLLSSVPVTAFAAEEAGTEATTTNGYYDANGNWVAGGTGTATYDVDGTSVTLSKTATPVAGQENTFLITLKVSTSTTTTIYTDGGAVVLVIDTSSSMQSCAECGSRNGHSNGCTGGQTRLNAAKIAAQNFVLNYAGSDPAAARMLAIVTFDGGYRTNMSWANVAGGSGSNSYDAAMSTISGLGSSTGTNMEGGLYTALGLLGNSVVSSFSSKNVVLLSDGAPTSRIGSSGISASKTNCDAAANQAAAIKATGAKLYTVCFGAARDTAYTGGPTVSAFLSGQVATSGCAYDADNSSELYAAFRAISNSITSGLSGLGWTATDPMADNISVVGGTSGNFSSTDGDTYTWTLTNAETMVEGNKTTYVYTYQYTIKLDPQGQTFEEGKFFPTNDRTYLNIGDEQLEFPVPGVKGVLPRTDVSVTKVWDDMDDQDRLRTDSVTVQLMEGERRIGEPVVLDASNNWSYTWDAETYDLIAMSKGQVHQYTVVELEVPKDYEVSYSKNGDFNLIVTNTHEVYKKDITVTKTWDDANNQDGIRPASITINLLADGEVVASAELNADNEWTYTFQGFEVNKDGVEIVYTIEEAVVPEGYTASVDGYTVTNSHETAKVDVTVNKIWDDAENQDGKRPNSVTVELYANGQPTGKKLAITGNSWSATFTGLDEFANGQRIVYTVVEEAVAGYTTAYSEDTLTITNTHAPETISISGTKTWNDNNDQDGARPESITINLLKNGQVIETKTVTAEDGWAWTFEGLYKYEAGELINYSIVEEAVEGYTASYNGYDVTNTHTPEQTSVTVVKAWDDANNQDGFRPNDITVVLLADGVDTGKTLVLNAGNNWTGSFTELDVYVNGNKIVYTVQEIAVDKYETVISGDQNIGYTITNTHAPETVEVSGTKTWVDNDNQDGKRPASITINLLANGEIIDSVEVTEEDAWTWTFTELPKYQSGEVITYSITENAVEEYVTTYDGFNVINTHAPEQTAVTVTKSWQDANDQDGIRPNDITVVLLANGEPTGETMILSEGNNWTGTFTDLDKYLEGQVIAYTVEELKITGYVSQITGNAADGYIITNIHTPETVTISGAKTWVDNDNQDGKRPASITINLLADGKVIETVTVTEAEEWTWSFENLPKYRDHGVQIIYTITENAVDEYYTAINGYDVTNTHDIEKTSVSVTKAWVDSNDQDGYRPESITVVLLANGEDTGKTLILTASNNWAGTFTELDKYADGEEIVYTIQELEVSEYNTVITGTQANGYTITNSHTTETVSVSGTKTWVDNDNQDGFRPESITINLLADGKVIETITVTEEDEWTWSFENLPKYRDHGTLIEYSITENAVEDYSTTYNGFNVTNTHTPEQTSVTVTKQWIDNNDQDGIRPNDITVILLANGEPTGETLVLSAGNNWTGSFTELDKYAAGEIIVYTVEELKIEGYETVITGSQNAGYSITNSHTPETVKVEGAKTWVDANNQDGFRPESITINLLADGVVIETIEVTEEEGWAWSFENLPKYKDHGTLIVYAITEEGIEDYTTTYNGYDVTNTHTPEETSVTVTKAWADANDQDGIRPESITVKLRANGEDTGKTLVLTAANNWTGSFTELDKYAEGEIIVYTVEELEIAGYASVITGDQNSGYTVTNTHTPETISVSGTKTWIDADNQDGFRPESITINLLADGKVIDTITVTEADDWSWTFENLPKYKDHGTEIVYSITEDAVEDYTTTYNGNNVTNTHTPEQTSVTVSKAWVDNNDQDGIRPNDITVILLANGEDTGKTLILSSGNNWTGSFTELDKYADGEIIVYTVEELKIEGYETVITGDQNTGYSITNSHTPETVKVEGNKTWVDENNQDGFRPASITINLLADGIIIDTITVTEEDGWVWSFENLPKYKDHGTLIEYSITEESVEDYTTTYNGYNVTNSHTPEQTSVTVTKAWADANNQDGIRPNDITVILLANGEDTGKTLILSSGNNWTGSFTELDKYADGEIIVYTVEELKIEGYETVITGDQNSGYIVTNTHTPETIAISGEKTWDDNDNQDGFRPESITINLLANGKVVQTITVTEADGWVWTFENLPKFENGVEIVYAITENAVEDYSTIYDGFNVTNIHTPEEISISVAKAWIDNDDQDGIRPDSIQVILLADGVPTGETLTLRAEDGWAGSFVELPKYSDGVEIEYTVEEVAVEGYHTLIIGDMVAGYIISNSHTPETIAISGVKTWDDANNQDGVRPESITVNLLANGEIVQTAIVTEADNWSYTFENLPKYANHGVEVIYAIVEEAVEGYTTTYDGYNITNSYTPSEIGLTVTKAWADSDDKDGLRPDQVTIVLYANGELTDKTLVLTAEENWTGSFVGLPKYANGVEIVYTIGEVTVEGYNTVIRGDMVSGFVVTNSHTVIPQTGDERTPALWMFMMISSVAVLAYLSYEDKKKRAVK